MLDEVSIDFRIDFSDSPLGINLDARFQGAGLRAENPRSAEKGFGESTAGKH
jgi:hypothetical protein